MERGHPVRLSAQREQTGYRVSGTLADRMSALRKKRMENDNNPTLLNGKSLLIESFSSVDASRADLY